MDMMFCHTTSTFEKIGTTILNTIAVSFFSSFHKPFAVVEQQRQQKYFFVIIHFKENNNNHYNLPTRLPQWKTQCLSKMRKASKSRSKWLVVHYPNLIKQQIYNLSFSNQLFTVCDEEGNSERRGHRTLIKDANINSWLPNSITLIC